MSEEEQRITKVEKEKDPRRVASGKRLAAISKLAKEKKAHERQQQHMERIDEEEDTHDGGYPTITVITGVGVLTGLVCLYFAYEQYKRAQMTTDTQPTNPVAPNNTPGTKMISLDE